MRRLIGRSVEFSEDVWHETSRAKRWLRPIEDYFEQIYGSAPRYYGPASVQESAQALNGMGLTLIPLHPGEKRPITSWRRMTGRQTSADVKKLFTIPDANIGLKLGPIRTTRDLVECIVSVGVYARMGADGCLVCNGFQRLLELKAAGRHLEPNACLKTGDGGVAFLRRLTVTRSKFKLLSGLRWDFCDLQTGIAFQGHGSYCLLPPSCVETKHFPLGDGNYEWINKAPEKIDDIPFLEGWVKILVAQRLAVQLRSFPYK